MKFITRILGLILLSGLSLGPAKAYAGACSTVLRSLGIFEPHFKPLNAKKLDRIDFEEAISLIDSVRPEKNEVLLFLGPGRTAYLKNSSNRLFKIVAYRDEDTRITVADEFNPSLFPRSSEWTFSRIELSPVGKISLEHFIKSASTEEHSGFFGDRDIIYELSTHLGSPLEEKRFVVPRLSQKRSARLLALAGSIWFTLHGAPLLQNQAVNHLTNAPTWNQAEQALAPIVFDLSNSDEKIKLIEKDFSSPNPVLWSKALSLLKDTNVDVRDNMAHSLGSQTSWPREVWSEVPSLLKDTSAYVRWSMARSPFTFERHKRICKMERGAKPRLPSLLARGTKGRNFRLN